MTEETPKEKTAEDGKGKGKEAAYVCRSCGAVAPKKKGLCRPEKIRRRPGQEE